MTLMQQRMMPMMDKIREMSQETAQELANARLKNTTAPPAN
jgi:hypothetical protein